MHELCYISAFGSTTASTLIFSNKKYNIISKSIYKLIKLLIFSKQKLSHSRAENTYTRTQTYTRLKHLCTHTQWKHHQTHRSQIMYSLKKNKSSNKKPSHNLRCPGYETKLHRWRDSSSGFLNNVEILFIANYIRTILIRDDYIFLV